MEYNNLDLNIEARSEERYAIKARSQTRGEVGGQLARDLAAPDFAESSRRLGIRTVSAAREIGGGEPLAVEAPTLESLQQFGEILWDAVFSNRLRDLYSECLGEVLHDDLKGVRIRLCVEAPELTSLPWELLYDRARDSFLATSIETPLTRYISLHEGIRNLETKPPVRILIVIPAASGLNVEAERRSITAALKGLGDTVEPVFLDGIVTRSAISNALLSKPFHVFHFIGHGVFRDDEGHLLINTEDGGQDVINGRSFAGFFKDYPSMKLAVLNACQGAEVSATQPLAGVAPQLVRRGVPAVVAMQYPIADKAAVLFATEFYRRLCTGWDRGRVDTAVSHARNRLEMDFPGTLAFATPVLFMRSSPGGVIFDLEASGEKKPLVPPAEDVHRLKALKATYDEDTKLLKESGEPAAEAAIAGNEQRAATLQRRIRTYYLVIAALLSVPVFLASWLSLFNAPFFLRLDDRAESRFVRAMDWLAPADFSRDIALVLADENGAANGTLGAPSPEWRCHHADLINGLAAAGARAVAFDLFFEQGVPACDAKLAAAIESARAAGTAVVVGIQRVDWVNGAPVPLLAESLRPAVRQGWGLLAGDPTARKVPLGVPPDEEAASFVEAQEVGIAPSFSLRTVMEVEAAQRGLLQAAYDRANYRVVVRDGGRAPVKSIPILDRYLSVIVDVPELRLMSGIEHNYADLVASASNPATLASLKNRIVVVGYKRDNDRWDVGQERPLYGVHLHAAAISNLLRDDYVRPLGLRWHYLLIVAMGVAGVLARTRFKRLAPQGLRLKVPGLTGNPLQLPVPLLAALAAYLAAAVFLYWLDRIILDFSYHVFALVFTYWLLGRLRWGIGVAHA